MKTTPEGGKAWYKHPVILPVFVGSTLLLGAICFGFLRVLTALPVWVCVSIALPSGILSFAFISLLATWSDGPPR